MMDIIMAGALLVGFVSIKLFVNWCEKQIDTKK